MLQGVTCIRICKEMSVLYGSVSAYKSAFLSDEPMTPSMSRNAWWSYINLWCLIRFKHNDNIHSCILAFFFIRLCFVHTILQSLSPCHKENGCQWHYRSYSVKTCVCVFEVEKTVGVSSKTIILIYEQHIYETACL